MKGSYQTNKRGMRIYIPDDMRQISGLVFEDRARTLSLFRPGNYAEHPTAPIDIAPYHDQLQGLGTHVKSIQQIAGDKNDLGFCKGTLELASTLEFIRLDGHHRYLLFFYDIYGELELDGELHKIKRCHTIAEAIFSPTTFSAMRGRYTLEHLAWIQRRLDDVVLTQENIEKQQNRFRNLMAGFDDFFGAAIHTPKLSMHKNTEKVGNQRIQSAVALNKVQAQLLTEGPYQGRFTQPNYREWHEGETCYGLKLPWYTIGKDRIFSAVGDPSQPLDEKALRAMKKRRKNRIAKRKIAPPVIQPSASRDQRYAVEEPKQVTNLAITDGMITVVRQQDDTRTIAIDVPDAQAYLRVVKTCERHGAKWQTVCGRWAASLQEAKEIVTALNAHPPTALPPPAPEYVDPLPPVPSENPLRANEKNKNLFHFNIGGKTASVLLMQPHGNWVILPHKEDSVNYHIDQACAPFAPEKPWDGDHQGNWEIRYNAARQSWIVRDQPNDLIQRVVTAIQQWKD